MAIFNKQAGAAVALLLSILIALVMLGGAGLQGGLKGISGANIITGSAIFGGACTGVPAACNSLDNYACWSASGCSWSDSRCSGGELKACNLFVDQRSCYTQVNCLWTDNECRTVGVRSDCSLLTGSNACTSQVTSSEGNCAWSDASCLGTPQECASYGWQSACESAGCQWATCEGNYFYGDLDSDGFGNPDDTIETCDRKKGYVDNPGDCNDKDPAIPAKSETPDNGIDDDCNVLTKDDGTSIEEIDITKVRAGQITKDSATITWKTDRDSTSFVNYGTTFKEYPLEKKDDTKTREHSITLSGLKEATKYYYMAGSCDTASDYCIALAEASYQFTTTKCTDADGDSYFAEGEACGKLDCDDADASVTSNIIYYRDADSDGFGDATLIINYCGKPNGYSKLSTDCNDNAAAVNPNATETCNNLDDNCNNKVDENTIVSYYADADGDGFGNISDKVDSCTLVAGRVNNSLDCNDNNPEVKPNAAEVCDEIDNNCNNQIDEGVQITSYVDFDKDGFGDANNKIVACTFVVENADNSLDCNDKDNIINPNATEVCNAFDDNCAGGVDEPFDADKDGYFNQTLCGSVTSYASKLDPADNNDNIHPGAAERCDGLDNDVNSAIDDIGGKTSASETKCACTGKTESQISDIKQTKERLNGEDDNCDGRLASEEADADIDGFATYQGDCDDFNRNVNPKASESCVNKIDDNCNGKIDDVSEGCTAPAQNPAAAVTNPASRTSVQDTQQATSIDQQILKGEQTSAAAAAAAQQAEENEAAIAASAALEEEKAGFSPWLFLPIGLVPLVILLAYLFYVKPRGGFSNLIGKKKKEDFVGEEFPAEEAKPAGIDSYISDTLAQGYSAEDIKKALLDKGWTEDAIEDAFRKQGLQ